MDINTLLIINLKKKLMPILCIQIEVQIKQV